MMNIMVYFAVGRDARAKLPKDLPVGQAAGRNAPDGRDLDPPNLGRAGLFLQSEYWMSKDKEDTS